MSWSRGENISAEGKLVNINYVTEDMIEHIVVARFDILLPEQISQGNHVRN